MLGVIYFIKFKMPLIIRLSYVTKEKNVANLAVNILKSEYVLQAMASHSKRH